MFVGVNLLSVFGAAIASMFVGFIWYHPAIFGNQYLKLAGIKKGDINQSGSGMAKSYFLMFVSSLVIAYFLSQVITFANSGTVAEGVITGFWVWLGFVATVLLGDVLFGKKPWKLYFLQASHYLVTFLVMGAILTLWV